MIKKTKGAPNGAPFAVLRRPTFALDLIAETEALQESRWLGILQRLLLCPGVWSRRDRYRRTLLFADPCSMSSMRPDLRARILYGSGPPVPLRGLDLGRGILCGLHRRNLRGPHGFGLRPCFFLGRPGLELLEQFFSDGLAGLGLALTSVRLALAWLGLALIGGISRRNNLFARRRVACRRQILRAGD